MKVLREVLSVYVAILLAFAVDAGVGGVVIKGAFKTWDEIARVALKVGGKVVSDDTVKITAHTIEQASQKYGDDVAEAAMQGGMEVVAKTAKSGGRFLELIRRSGQLSDDAIKVLVANSDEALKLSAKYGDEVLLLNSKAPGVVPRAVETVEGCGLKDSTSALRAIADLPAEDIPRVIGAVEKNPSVAKLFVEHVERGGKYFVDKVFALNGKQIMAGELGAAAIVAAYGAVSPLREIGSEIAQDGDKKRKIVDGFSHEEKKKWANKIEDRVYGMLKLIGLGGFFAVVVLASSLGIVIYKRMVFHQKKEGRNRE